jgi:hypothetical protein
MIHATLDSWIRDDAIPFSLDSSETLSASIDGVALSLDPSVELLGFGEALHGGAKHAPQLRCEVLRRKFPLRSPFFPSKTNPSP